MQCPECNNTVEYDKDADEYLCNHCGWWQEPNKEEEL